MGQVLVLRLVHEAITENPGTKKTMEKPWAVESIGFAEVQQWGVWAK